MLIFIIYVNMYFFTLVSFTERPSEFVAMLRERESGQCPSTKVSDESDSSQISDISSNPSNRLVASISTKDTVQNSQTSSSGTRQTTVIDGKVCTRTKQSTSSSNPASSRLPSPKQTLSSAVSFSNDKLAKRTENTSNSVFKSCSNVSISSTLEDSLPARKDPLMSEGAPDDDPSSGITVEVDSEKEDVTATLALLNSMASELDNALDL